jgi:beta-lactamase superfamily II metal-dependent hydrolase
MNKLRVRVYNVGFGDAILVSVPEGGEVRHMLIDVGNVLQGEGGADAFFEPVMRDILAELGGRPLDLYVMSHEHLDHAQGLLYASERLGLTIAVRQAWLTASAAEDYYERHPEAQKKRLEIEKAMAAIERFFAAVPAQLTPLTRALALNNNPSSTAQCVAHLRGVAERTTYVYRGCSLRGRQPFREARLSIWAPEEDTSDYYGSLQPMALGVTLGDQPGAEPTLTTPVPPPGVDAGVFYDLVEMRRQVHLDNLLTIDRAANNTSVVLCLQWRGWRLLFPGDAEQKSWKTMGDRGVLRPVHFLKVSHHGSWNGTPPPGLLDKILPAASPDARPRRAVVSTRRDTYNNVPDRETLAELARRCELRSVELLPADQFFLDIEFEA